MNECDKKLKFCFRQPARRSLSFENIIVLTG